MGQEERRMQEGWKFIWHYKNVGFYYQQVKAYLENFDHVMVCLFDDLKRDTVSLARDVYRFLDVDPSYMPDARTRHNVSGIPRSNILNDFFVEPSIVQRVTKKVGKAILKEDGWVRLRERLRAKLLAKAEMLPETRQHLQDTYREDIMRLQELIQRDLSPWLNGRD